ncbi:MAG: alanine racemase [Mycobacteriaceae bacterium]
MRSSAHISPQTKIGAQIDLGAIASNVRVLVEHASAAEVMAVVKADGYGHGAVLSARTALEAGATELGVATVEEGIELRHAGISAPILSWLHTAETDFVAALKAGVDVTVSTVRHLAAVVAAAEETRLQGRIAIKVDTGLNRNGVTRGEWPDLLAELLLAQASESITVVSMFSHLARADEPNHPVINQQAEIFSDLTQQASSVGLRIGKRHLANSAATLTRQDLHFDMVRPGVAVYGLSPVPGLGDFGLIPAMTLKATVARVKSVIAGEGVSYSHSWIAPEDTYVALIPLGYADGIPRRLGGQMVVSIGGKLYPSIGRICMDQFMIDLGSDGGGVSEDDEVILFGPGAGGEPLAQDWADLLETIHYEVVTGIKGRSVRSYVGHVER